MSRYNSINLRVTGVVAVGVFAASIAASGPLIGLFARPDTHVYLLAMQGFSLCSLAFLFMGFNDYASSFFTALNDGRTSAIISFMRTLVFTLGALLVMPQLWGITGLWLAMPAAELASVTVSTFFLVKKRHVLHYAKPAVPAAA